METSRDRTWVLSVVAALVVALVVLAGWWLTQPRSGADLSGDVAAGGSASGEPGGEPDGEPGGGVTGSPGDPGTVDPGAADDDPPAVGAAPVVVENGVRIDGYAGRGTRLVLRYVTGVPECYGEVEVAEVAERAASVTVRLVAIPPVRKDIACIDLAVLGSVTVELTSPLGDRQVLDGAFEPPVPVERGSGFHDPS